MFTKFDKFEMFEFFEMEPVCVGEYEEEIWMYTLEENNFKLLVLVDTYAAVVDVSVSYQENLVYSGSYMNVEEIRKSDDKALRMIIREQNDVILKKGNQIGVIMEE